MKIKIVNKSKQSVPSYSTDASAGMDLKANIDKELISKHEKAEWININEIMDTARGTGSFGHTGKI
jgi:dUTPase